MRLIIDRDVPVEMRDGTVLQADVYRPDNNETWPVLLQRTPYEPRRSASGSRGWRRSQLLLSPTAKNGMKLSDQISPSSFKMDSPHRLQSPFPHRYQDRYSNTVLLCAAHVHTLSHSIRALYPSRRTLQDADVVL